MALAKHTRFGPYEILTPIGAGGMGEVYRARDTRLNREVAIKIIRNDSVATPGLRARFETEAKAVAALNHPNIVSIFDVGEEQGVLYTVSELIDGESLRTILRKGAMPASRVIQIAVQITDGLAAAHAARKTHRDLKPENIMLTSEGRVKILDFGLARLTGQASESGDSITAQTDPGAVVGTPSYMSPEQVRGEAVDYRSDQFSFALVVYEMAAGRKAFEKASAVETMAAIVREDAAPIDAKLPGPLRWAIDRCLAKDPKGRYESTRDLYRDLLNQQEHLSELFPTIPASPAKTRARKNWFYLAIPAACLLAGAAAALLSAPKRHGIENHRYTPIEISRENPNYPTWTPDGKAFSYAANVDGKPQAFVR